VQERVIRVHNILGTADQVEATSGGTESILMSVKTHRDWAKSVKGITKPEMYVSGCILTHADVRVSGLSRHLLMLLSGKPHSTSG
jgi:hypothetical protein